MGFHDISRSQCDHGQLGNINYELFCERNSELNFVMPYDVNFVIISRVVCFTPQTCNTFSATTGGRKQKTAMVWCVLSKLIAWTCDSKKYSWKSIIFSI